MNYLDDCIKKQIQQRVRNCHEELGMNKTFIRLAQNILPDNSDINPNTYAREISNILKGDLGQNRGSYVSDSFLYYMSNYLNVTTQEFLFGNEDDIEELLRILFKNLFYSVNQAPITQWMNYDKYYYEDLIQSDIKYSSDLITKRHSLNYIEERKKDLSFIQKIIKECLLYNAKLSYEFSKTKMLILNDFYLIGDDPLHFDLMSNTIFEYNQDIRDLIDYSLDEFWNLIKFDVIESFKKRFYTPEMDYLGFQKEIIDWIRVELRVIISFRLDWLKKNKVSKVGYEVLNEMENARSLEKEYMSSFGAIGFERDDYSTESINCHIQFIDEFKKLMLENVQKKIDIQNQYWNLIGSANQYEIKIKKEMKEVYINDID